VKTKERYDIMRVEMCLTLKPWGLPKPIQDLSHPDESERYAADTALTGSDEWAI
jgi:hypothetical protein